MTCALQVIVQLATLVAAHGLHDPMVKLHSSRCACDWLGIVFYALCLRLAGECCIFLLESVDPIAKSHVVIRSVLSRLRAVDSGAGILYEFRQVPRCVHLLPQLNHLCTCSCGHASQGGKARIL